ncbi:hypothetical protein L4D08_06710 [Photobacterium chitinilyticum]|uniref:hypothetical protein n=1 Tax=Photobacterium chitinilyticum TaxID=2485123 RepID=UPI003D0C3DCF
MMKFSNIRKLIIISLFLKVAIGVLFTSQYQTILFNQSILSWLDNGYSPWNGLLTDELPNYAFPYPAVMLYVLSIFYSPILILGQDNLVAVNLFNTLPLLLADLIVLITLIKLSNKVSSIFVIYFISPVIIFTTYIHHQLDIIPVSLLMISLLFLKNRRILYSAVFLSLGMATKFNIAVSLPLLLIYVFKRFGLRLSVRFAVVSFVTFLALNFPFLLSEQFIHQLVFNNIQSRIFSTVIEIADRKIYLTPVFITLVYFHFLSYRKVNFDLLILYIVSAFSVFLIFFDVSPAWYVWILPLASYLIVKSDEKLLAILSFSVLVLSFLAYYVLFANYELVPILLISTSGYIPLDLQVDWNEVRDILYTVLKCSTVIFLYVLYRYSTINNKLYKNYKPFLIGIGGESGTGKTTLQALLKDLLDNQVLQIEGDGDHKWERGHTNWSKYSHLNPKANWLHRQAHDLIALKKGKTILRSDYCHSSGTFKEKYSLKAGDYVSISGLHPFYLPLSRNTLDLKIFMDPEESLRRHWKIERDTKHRGYSIEKIIDQIESRMFDAKKYIYPQRKYADIIFSYFSSGKLQLGEDVSLSLRIMVDASYPIEMMIENLSLSKDIEFDYSEDLNFQIITVLEEPSIEGLEEVARTHIPNLDELCSLSEFQSGYDGLIQFMILLTISDKLQQSK